MTDTRELVELIRAALNFCNAAAGEGLEIDGMSPEEFLMTYSDATGFTDWEKIGDHAADTITALSERCRALEEAIHDADQTLMLLGDTGWRKRHRAALAGGRG